MKYRPESAANSNDEKNSIFKTRKNIYEMFGEEFMENLM